MVKSKLAKATVNALDDPTQSNLLFTTEVDKMEIPKDYKQLIKICRFFYKRDPIAGQAVNKMVDCAITPLRNRRALCTEEEIAVYNSLLEMLQEFFRNVFLEYLLSGLVIPHYEWVRKSGAELSDNLNSRRRVWVPDNIWFRDPATVTIKKSPIPNKKYFYVEVSPELIEFIKNKGKVKGKPEDRETYEALVNNYPDFVKAIQDSKGFSSTQILLTDVRPITGRWLPDDLYPTPYMTNALESLMHKRNLRKMDYAIAARVTAAIQLVKLGSDEFPCTDSKDFDDIKDKINYNTTKGQAEKIFQLFANHTLTIEWVHPDTAAMLNQEKYRSVEDDIISALGFPRSLITGETLRSNVTAGSEMATFSPVATMEGIRDKLVEWTKGLYKEVQEKNRFAHCPIPRFEQMKLYKLLDLDTIGKNLYMEGSLSRTSRLEMQGLDLETELERKRAEEEEYKKRGLDKAPAIPFSSPQINQPSTPQVGKADFDIDAALSSLSPEQIAEKYKALEDFEYLTHHVEVDDKGKEILHHCLLYDHIANMYVQAHLVIKDGKVYMDGKKAEEGRYHVISGLEPEQEKVWSDEEAEEANIKPKRMRKGMTKKEKSKEW